MQEDLHGRAGGQHLGTGAGRMTTGGQGPGVPAGDRWGGETGTRLDFFRGNGPSSQNALSGCQDLTYLILPKTSSLIKQKYRISYCQCWPNVRK